MKQQSLYEQSNVAAHKEMLKQDLALRISGAIDAASLLFNNFAFAPIEKIEQTENVQEELDKLYSERSIVQNAEIKKQITLEINKLENTPEAETGYVRQIDMNVFKSFLISFYQIWLETKDQIRDDKAWIREIQEHVAMLFENTQNGQQEPRKALKLFEKYMTLLENCGIMHFTYNVGFTKGEKFRGSV